MDIISTMTVARPSSDPRPMGKLEKQHGGRPLADRYFKTPEGVTSAAVYPDGYIHHKPGLCVGPARWVADSEAL